MFKITVNCPTPLNYLLSLQDWFKTQRKKLSLGLALEVWKTLNFILLKFYLTKTCPRSNLAWTVPSWTGMGSQRVNYVTLGIKNEGLDNIMGAKILANFMKLRWLQAQAFPKASREARSHPVPMSETGYPALCQQPPGPVHESMISRL